jgi:hypothetical protein
MSSRFVLPISIGESAKGVGPKGQVSAALLMPRRNRGMAEIAVVGVPA